MTGNRLSGKKSIFLICWATYILAYMCRVNLSSAMLKIQDGLNVGADLIGVAGGLFFLFYAVGQFINGFLGDRVSPYRFIFLAALGTAFLNIFIAAQNNIYIIMCCWAVNGYVQSMFWGPLVRILAGRFNESERADVSVGMQTTSLFGTVISWVVLGRILMDRSWRLYFVAPSVIILLSSAAWIYLSAKNPVVSGPGAKPRAGVLTTIKIILDKQMRFTVLICVCLGLIRDSVTLWLPAMLVSALGIDVKNSFLIILGISVINFMGALLSRKLLARYQEKIAPVMVCLFTVIAACSALSALLGDLAPMVSVLMIAAVSAMSIGLTTILLMFLPLSYAKDDVVSSVVGMLDFSVYAGAAVSSFVIGVFFTDLNLRHISALWAAVAAAAVALSLAVSFTKSK